MADERLKLKELGVRVEAMFQWPGDAENEMPYSMPDAAAEISERLQALERRLSPGGPPSDLAPPAAVAAPAPQLPTGGDGADGLLERLARLEEAAAQSRGLPDQLVQVLDRLAALDERLGAPGAGDAPGEGAVRLARLEALAETFAPAQELLAEAWRRLELLEQVRAAAPRVPEEIGEILSQLAALDGRLGSLDELSATAELVGELARRLEDLEQTSASKDDIPEVGTTNDRLAALEERLGANERAPGTEDQLAERLERLEQLVASTLERVDELLSATDVPAASAELLGEFVGRLDRLESQSARSAAPDEREALIARLDALEVRLEAIGVPPDMALIDAVSRRLEQLEDRAAPPGSEMPELLDLTCRIETLEGRVDAPEANGAAASMARITGRLDQLEQLGATHATTQIEPLRSRLEALEARLERPPTDPSPTLLAELLQRLEALERRPRPSVTASPPEERRTVSQPEALDLEVRDQPHLSLLSVASEVGAAPSPPVEERALAASTNHSEPRFDRPNASAQDEPPPSRSAASGVGADPSVIELLSRDLAPLHSQFGPLTVAPDETSEAPSAAASEAPPSGKRFRKLMR